MGSLPCFPAAGDLAPCGFSFCGKEVCVGAEFLYWKPCTDDLDVAAILETDGDFTDVDYKRICPGWEPGYRVYLNLPDFYCSWNLSASYTSLKSTENASQSFEDPDDESGIISPLIYPAEPFTDAVTFSEGKERWELKYQEWDVLASYDVVSNSCQRFTPFFGIAGIYLEQELKAEFLLEDAPAPAAILPKQIDQGMENSIKWDSQYWGVGLRFGSEYEYYLCSGFSLFANADATLLAGKADAENKQLFINTNTEEEAEIKHDDDGCCHFVPGYRIAAGLNYQSCWCGWNFGLRIGYEFTNWHNIPNHRVYSGENTGSEASHSSPANTRTLGFHGLTAGASLIF
jgi:hypothetical protein